MIPKGTQNIPILFQDCCKLLMFQGTPMASWLPWSWSLELLPKIAPRWTQRDSRRPKMLPKMAQEGRKMAQNGPDERLPEAPRGSQRLPEAPRGSQRLPEAPRGSQKLPEAPRGPQRPPEAPRGSQMLPDALRGSQRLPILVVALLDPRHPGPYITL